MPKLTKSIVEAIPVPRSVPAYAWDDRVAGFGVKVLPSGSRKYVLKYRTNRGRNGRQRWLSLGTHGAITADQARSLAQLASGQIAAGEDPQGERQAVSKQATVAQLWEKFAGSELLLNKAATQRDYESLWTRLIKPKLGSKRVTELTRDEVGIFHKGLSKRPYQANRALAVLSRLMNLAEAWDWRPQGTNPCKYVSKFKEKARQRFLSADEIATLRSVIERMSDNGDITKDAGNLLQLLLLTGARSSELKNAQWGWVDEQRKIIELPDSKTGPRTIYIGDAAAELLERQRRSRDEREAKLSASETKALSVKRRIGEHINYIFPGRADANEPAKPIHNLRKPWLRVCESAGLSGVRIHDLRHTAASVAIAEGASLAVIGRLLGHTQAQTTLRYAHLADDPALIAANLIGNAVGRPQRVVADTETS